MDKISNITQQIPNIPNIKIPPNTKNTKNQQTNQIHHTEIPNTPYNISAKNKHTNKIDKTKIPNKPPPIPALKYPTHYTNSSKIPYNTYHISHTTHTHTTKPNQIGYFGYSRTLNDPTLKPEGEKSGLSSGGQEGALLKLKGSSDFLIESKELAPDDMRLNLTKNVDDPSRKFLKERNNLEGNEVASKKDGTEYSGANLEIDRFSEDLAESKNVNDIHPRTKTKVELIRRIFEDQINNEDTKSTRNIKNIKNIKKTITEPIVKRINSPHKKIKTPKKSIKNHKNQQKRNISMKGEPKTG